VTSNVHTNKDKTSGKWKSEPVSNIRIKISALWVSLLFIFAYVDLFSLYRSDFRSEIESGQISGFDINQMFLFLTTLYILIPSLMVAGTVLLPARPVRILNIALGVFYAVTILAGAVGEWSYYVFGSVIEFGLLVLIVVYAWKWPKNSPMV
jgi:hypothetical protein